jgi:VWFA-related protein
MRQTAGLMARVAAVAALSAGAFAQAPDQGQFQSAGREVIVDVVVRDSHGKLVKKVNPKDLAVYEDGVRRDILSWRLVGGQESRRQEAAPAATAQPTAGGPSPVENINLICLVFHDIAPELRTQAYQAARNFIETGLRPDTIMGVFSLDDRGVHPKARFTADRAVLLQAIERASSGAPPTLHSAVDLFAALGLERNLALFAPPPSAPAGGPQQAAITPADTNLALVQSTLDASIAYGDEASTVAMDPLGRNGPHEQRVVGMRELHAFNWLVDQLCQMPFRKAVILFSPGINRPSDQMDYWKTMIRKANTAGINFYALELSNATAASSALAANAELNRVGDISQGQSTTDSGAGGLSRMANRSQEFDRAEQAIITSNTHATLVRLAEDTGGFLITDAGKKMLARVAADAETRFELTYSPTWRTYDGRYHKIEVKSARPNLTVEARTGYYSVPAKSDGAGLSIEEMSAFRALNTTPLPHQFDYGEQTLRFRARDGLSDMVFALEVPFSSLAASPEPALKKHRLHASLMFLVKDSDGQIVQRFSGDSPMEVPDAELAATQATNLTFERHVALAPGRYTVESAVVDWESGRVSTGAYQIDCVPHEKGPELSSISFARGLEQTRGPISTPDPLDYLGKRVVLSSAPSLEAGSKAPVFFRVYPDPSATGKVTLKAQFLVNGETQAEQSSELDPAGAPDGIPMMFQLPVKPGANELKLTAIHGNLYSARTIKFTVPEAK